MEKTTEPRNMRVTMIVLLMLIYIFTFAFVSTALSALLPVISADLGLDLVQQGAAVGALPLGIALFTFVAGVLLDKSSTRYIMFMAVLVCGVGIFMRGAATSFQTLYASMFILGIGQAFMFPAAAKAVATWYRREELFKYNGFLIAASPIGMFTGFNAAGPIATAIGWPMMFQLVAGGCVVVALLWVLLARDRKNEDVELNQQLGVDTTNDSFFDHLKAVMSKRQTWTLTAGESVFQAVMATSIALGVTIVMGFEGATLATAALTVSLGNAGSLSGYFLLPSISEKYGVKKPFIWTSMLFYGLCLIIAYNSGHIPTAMVLFFVGSFFNGWCIPGPRSMLIESPGMGGMRAATALGLMSTGNRAVAAVLPMLFAFVAGIGGVIMGATVNASLVIIAAFFIFISDETGMGREAAEKAIAERKARQMAAKG